MLNRNREKCTPLQKSLEWCEGQPEYPGIRKRIYYVAKADIVTWPKLPVDANGKITVGGYVEGFVLAADKYWHHIDVLPDKCEATSDPPGEMPSQTQLNKLVAVYPGVGEKATKAGSYINNVDNVYVVEDMRGFFRVIGSERWMTKSTFTQDLGKGPTGNAASTLNAECTDVLALPFYYGKITEWDEASNTAIDIWSSAIHDTPMADEPVG